MLKEYKCTTIKLNGVQGVRAHCINLNKKIYCNNTGGLIMYEYISTIILNRVLNYSIIPLQLSATWDEAKSHKFISNVNKIYFSYTFLCIPSLKVWFSRLDRIRWLTSVLKKLESLSLYPARGFLDSWHLSLTSS